MMASVTKATQSSPARLALPVALLLSSWAISTPLAAQQKRGTSRQQQQAPAAAPAPKPATADAVEVANEATLFVQPDNGVAGSLKPGATGRIVGQSGDWVRVQVEGWVKASDLKESTEGVLVGISAAEVRANPDRFVGKTVDWRLQLVSVQTADELRPEMPAGQSYLLMRGPLPEPGFVYVMVTPAQAGQMRAQPPLGEMRLRVTIKAPRSRYLPTPVVELESVLDGLATK